MNFQPKEIKYLKFSNEHKSDLLKCISEIINEVDAHNKNLNLNLMWNWRNEEIPSKQSLVYLAFHNNKIIGYYHIPIFTILINNQPFKLGHIESVAILKPYRKFKIFRDLADFANEDANKILDVIYTFPNDKSIHTFIKYNNFTKIGTYPVYILPTQSDKIISSRINLLGFQNIIGFAIDWYADKKRKSFEDNEIIVSFKHFNQEIIELFKNFSRNYSFSLLRDKKYLNWRYDIRPESEYKIAGLKVESDLRAVIVYKEEVIFQNSCIVILDMAFNDISYLQKLLCGLTSFESEINPSFNSSFIFISGFINELEELKNCGFINVPKKLIPRKLDLLARWTGKSINNSMDNTYDWLATLGDWDVF